jgi:glycosyltransferase involved in cell wall biosynthesis
MNNDLKVLHVIPTLKKDGAEVQLAAVLNDFKNLKCELFTFDLYKNGDSIEDSIKNILVHGGSSFNFLNLYKLIKNGNYHIIHSHLPKADFYIGFISFFIKSYKHIISVHAKYGTRSGENKIKYFFSNILWKQILKKSDGVIAISNSIKKWLIDEFKIDQDEISVIHYGVKIKERRLTLDNGNVIGMAARLLPWKGWMNILEVAYHLKNYHVDFKLKLAGSDDIGYLKNIRTKIREYDLENNVEILTHFSNIDDFFNDIDLFLFLSESEGFGLVALEAIESNTAVVCSNISPLNEFVLDYENCLVDRDDTKNIAKLIKYFFHNKHEVLKNVQKNQKINVVKRFSLDKTVNAIEKFYINKYNN